MANRGRNYVEYLSTVVVLLLLVGKGLCRGVGRRDRGKVLTGNPRVESALTQSSLADRMWVSLKLSRFYERISELQFCFNFDSPAEVLELLRATLPAETLMSGTSPNTDGALVEDSDAVTETEDDVCSNWDNMADHICQTEEDYILYFQFVLQFDDPEKIPDTSHCSSANLTDLSGGCLPGFFQTRNGSHRCCDGFFCPQMMNCMIPCPVGANCPRAHAVVVPQNLLHGLDTSVKESICSPYGYQERYALGCGGADKWNANPIRPFFPVGDNRGHIYCPSGHYCEDTISEPELCHKGSYCRYGSVKPARCPLMTICDAGTSLPEDYFGMAFDGFMFILLALTWQASKYYNRIIRRLSARERIRIHWGVHPSCDIVSHTGNGFASDNAGAAESPFAKGPRRPSFLPKLVALQTFSSTITRTFARSGNTSSARRASGSEPAVWASLSQELRPHEVEDDGRSPTPPDPVMEEVNMNAITIDFYAVNLKVRSCGKLVVTGASGKFASSKLTVVMGPSGCGKTSLLSYLAGHGDYTMTNGMILLNGVQTTLKKHHKVTGFVPQDDIIHPKLTVEENLLFSARYRLPRSTRRQDHLAVVDRAIQLLGLVEVRNQLVGNEESRGVSGGQRKRVNIGLELVADPWVLFMDEPTSGLDSTSCRHVLSALAKIAHMGVTCAAVVHQPSNRVMKMFDDVLLMGRNGRTVYYGPQATLKTYFQSLGFNFLMDENPADVYLDIITRPKAPPIDPRKTLTEIWEISDLHDKYLTQPQLDADLAPDASGHTPRYASGTVLDGSGLLDRVKNTIWLSLYVIVSPFCLAIDNISKSAAALCGNSGYALLSDHGREEELRLTPRVHTQFWLCFYRCILERSRTALRIFLEYALYAISGMILGILSDARSSGRLKFFVSDMNYNLVAIGLMTTIGESRAGLNKLAYYCAMALFGDVGSILKGLCYLSLYYSYAQPRALFGDMFLVTSATIYSCSGFGYLISKVLRPGPAQLTAAVFVLSNALLTSGRTSTLIAIIRNILYHRWALEAYTISEAKQLFGVWSLERCGTLHIMNYDIRNFGFTVFALVLLGFVTRIMSFGIIMFGMRNKSD